MADPLRKRPLLCLAVACLVGGVTMTAGYNLLWVTAHQGDSPRRSELRSRALLQWEKQLLFMQGIHQRLSHSQGSLCQKDHEFSLPCFSRYPPARTARRCTRGTAAVPPATPPDPGPFRSKSLARSVSREGRDCSAAARLGVSDTGLAPAVASPPRAGTTCPAHASEPPRSSGPHICRSVS